jgi:hypothetical protein
MSQITGTIFKQITIGTKMACGARDFVGGDDCSIEGICKGMPFLWFRVGGNRKLQKIVVAYDRRTDAYNILFIDINRKTYQTTIVEFAEEVYVENMNEVIYRMVNK